MGCYYTDYRDFIENATGKEIFDASPHGSAPPRVKMHTLWEGVRRQLTLCMAEVIVVEADLSYNLINEEAAHGFVFFGWGRKSYIWDRIKEGRGSRASFFNTLTITGIMRVRFCPYGRNHAHKDSRGGAKDTRFEPSGTDFL